jgi:hypothetical protein
MRGVFRDIVGRALWQARSVSLTGLLAVLGVVIGAANIVALITVTDTARYQSFSLMRDVGASAILVYPFVEGEQQSILQRANASAFLPVGYADALREVPELEDVAALMLMPGRIRAVPESCGNAPQSLPRSGEAASGPGNEAGAGTAPEPASSTTDTGANAAASARDGLLTIVEGANPDYPAARGHKVVRGRFFTWAEERAAAHVCCLGSAIPEKLFDKANPLGRQIELRGERLTVIGVMIEKGVIGFESFDERIFTPLSTAQKLYELPGAHFIISRAKDAGGVKAAQEAARAKLRAVAGLAPDEPADFTVSTVEEVTGVIDNTFRVFKLLLYGIASVALLVAGIGIMNVMLMQVIERTREIGVRRAVGARRSAIVLQFITEAMGQALVGTALGILLGLAASHGFCWIVKWQVHVRAETLVLAALFSSGVGLLFGVYPAVHAAMLNPVDCLRYE